MNALEYNRFGPWVVEISEEDPVPPLFLPYVKTEESPLFSMKIPRREERRNLRPGMNLYDYVISLYQTELQILARTDDTVQQKHALYSDILGLSNYENLLDGRLFFYLVDQTYEIPYNTVSSKLLQKFITLIRNKYISSSGKQPPEYSGDFSDAQHGTVSYYFKNLLPLFLKEEAGLQLGAVQGEVQMGEKEPHLLKKLLYKASDKRLLESMHLTNGKEIVIISRGKLWGYRWQAQYGKEICYLPLEKTEGFECRNLESEKTVTACTIALPGSTHTFLFMNENPDLSFYKSSL